MIFRGSAAQSGPSPLPTRRLCTLVVLLQLIFAQSASACGWWGDGEGSDDADVTLVGKDGKPVSRDAAGVDADPVQMTRTANVLRRGAKSAKDLLEAAHLYRRAAEMGFVPAQNNLAAMYETGIGVPVNLPEAARWYRSAAEGGFAHAQHSFGEMLLNGRGVAKDALVGASWVERAAKQGHKSACVHLARMYWEGAEVPRAPVKALVWAVRAETLGDPEAPALKKRILSVLSTAEIDKADHSARQWQPKREYRLFDKPGRTQ